MLVTEEEIHYDTKAASGTGRRRGRLQRGLRDQRPARHDVLARVGAGGGAEGFARSAARAADARGIARLRRSVSPRSLSTTFCCIIRTNRSCRWWISSSRRPAIRRCWPSSKRSIARAAAITRLFAALAEAAENGKHVTALVELKARFDEANNITWARHLERAGVHVVFGFMGLKTHCKLAMVVRREGKKVRRYVHLSTGNYNPNTALVYTDLGLFTADKVMADDVSALFNLLTGYSQNHQWQKLVVAPSDLKRRTLELINEQAQRAQEGKRSRIIAKLNSLVDRRTIEALYQASQAGVPIDLLIRGICCLRPGLAADFGKYPRAQHRGSFSRA